MDQLFQKFQQCIESTSIMVGTPNDVLSSLCEQLVSKISHTISNDFLRNITTLDNLKNKKATDAQISLRDELKTFASHKASQFSTTS